MRRKEKKKPNLLRVLGGINCLSVRRAVIILAAGAGLVFLAGYVWMIVRSSGCFKVQDVIVRGDARIDFSYLKGNDIFSLDLNKECDYILKSYPDCHRVSLVRVLPNRVFVDFLKRKPLAWVKLSENFAVDEEGVLFSFPEIEKERLPVILGLEKKIISPRAGTKYAAEGLKLALRIIKEFKRNRILDPYRIRKIDAGNVLRVKIFIGPALEERGFEDLEVRLSEDNLAENIKILAGFLQHSQNGITSIEYVDFGFRDPVVKLKDAK